MLDSTKAHQRLGWRQRLSLDDALRLSLDWYAQALAGNVDMQAVTSRQIEYYLSLA